MKFIVSFEKINVVGYFSFGWTEIGTKEFLSSMVNFTISIVWMFLLKSHQRELIEAKRNEKLIAKLKNEIQFQDAINAVEHKILIHSKEMIIKGGLGDPRMN
jgi:hypothetical protein